jgi:hypothetical protein
MAAGDELQDHPDSAGMNRRIILLFYVASKREAQTIPDMAIG